MANKKLKYSQLAEDKILEPLIKEYKRLLVMLRTVEKEMKSVIELNTELAKSKGFDDVDKIQDTEKAIVAVFKAVDELNENQKDRVKTQKILNELELQQKKALNEQREAFKAAAKQQREAEKEAKALAKQRRLLNSEYARESKQLNDLRKKYKDLASANKGNTKEAKALLRQITKLDKKLKDIDSTVGQNQRRVGEYERAFKGLRVTIGGFAKATGLAALVGILSGLGDAFRQNSEGAASLEKVIGRFTITLGVFINRVIKGLPAVIKAFSSFGDLASEAFSKASLQIELAVTKSINKLGLFDDQIDVLERKIASFGKSGVIGNISNAFEGMGEEIEGLIKKNDRFIDATLALRRALLGELEELAVLRKERERIAEAADNATKSLRFQREQGLLLVKADEEIFAKELKIAKERIRIARLEADAKVGNIEAQEKVTALVIELTQLEEDQQQKKLDALRKVAEDDRDIWEQRLDFLQDIADSLKTVGEKIAADETQSFIDRRKALTEAVRNTNKAFLAEAEEFRKAGGEALDIESLVRIKDTLELLDTIEATVSDDFDEIDKQRLLLSIKDRQQAIQDLAESERDLVRAEAEGLALLKEIEAQDKALIELNKDSADGNKILADLEKETLDLQIANLKLRLEAIKELGTEGSKEELDIQKELNELLLDQHQKRLDAQLKKDQEALEKRRELQEAGFAILGGFQEKQNEDALKRIDGEIEANKAREDELRELAQQGNQDAKDNLAQNQKIQAEADLKRERQLKKAQREELVLTTLQTYAANVAAGEPNALGKTILDVQVLREFINSLPTFYGGTELVKNDATPIRPGPDGYMYMSDGEERIMSGADNRLVPNNMSNHELALLANSSRTGETSDSMAEQTRELSLKLDELGVIIDGKKALTDIRYNDFERAMVHTFEERGRLERNHVKTGGVFGG